MRKDSNIKNCLNCKKPFKRINSRKVFCSQNCCSQYNAKEKREKMPWYGKVIECKYCGVKFSIIRRSNPEKQFCCHQHAINYDRKRDNAKGRKCAICGQYYCPIKGNWKYCSDDCDPYSEKQGRMKKNKDYTIKCRICGTEFCYFSSKTKYGKIGNLGNKNKYGECYHFCSYSCKRKHYNELNTKWRHNKYKTKVHKCKNCGVEFCRIPGSKLGTMYFCGLLCRSNYYKEKSRIRAREYSQKMTDSYIKGKITYGYKIKYENMAVIS